MKTLIKALLSGVFFCWVLSGCVGQEAFTKMARSGDTVALALGGSPAHELDPNVRKADMSASITDSSGVSYPVKLRHLFKLHPDPTSKFNYSATYEYDSAIFSSRYYRQPNQGEWIAVIDLVDPQSNTLLPLVAGMATLQVTTPDLVNSLPFGIYSSDGNLASIEIEILDGTGSIHDFNDFGSPGMLEPLPQIEISFDNSQITDEYVDIGSAIVVGAVGFTIDYDDSVFSLVYPPMVRGNINDPRILVHAADIDDNGNRVLKVIALTAEKGIVANPDPTLEQDATVKGLRYSKIGDLRIFITWDPALLAAGPINASNVNSVFQISGGTAVDTNGAALLGTGGGSLITPVVSLRD